MYDVRFTIPVPSCARCSRKVPAFEAWLDSVGSLVARAGCHGVEQTTVLEPDLVRDLREGKARLLPGEAFRD